MPLPDYKKQELSEETLESCLEKLKEFIIGHTESEQEELELMFILGRFTGLVLKRGMEMPREEKLNVNN